FYSDGSVTYSGFDFDVTYTGACVLNCDAPTLNTTKVADCAAGTFDLTLDIGDDGDSVDYGVSYSVNGGTMVSVGDFPGGSTDIPVGTFNVTDIVAIDVNHNSDSDCNQSISG